MKQNDKVAYAEDHGIVFEEMPDGVYWRAAEDAPEGFSNGPFQSKLQAAEDFISGADNIDPEWLDEDEPE
jgi:hypothetical protein